MSNDEKIANALALLEEAATGLAEPPAMVVMPPDSGDFIIGNKGGFVHLAIASLKASVGERQPFKDRSWATEAELDWTVNGLKYDPSAHIYLPNQRNKSLWQRGVSYSLPAFAAICLLVGFVTIIRFLFRMH